MADPRPIRTLLIANRGEIAVRIIRTARSMGIRTVAVHSDPDAGALHVRSADVAVSLGGTTSAESYLRIDAIIAAAKATGADAIHPGYGFLSENAAFAEACEAAGITFVGPPVPAIEGMGDKITAKATMDAAGVPTVPGWTGPADAAVDTIVAAAADVGFPLMVKAAAGGGGKGMRVVHEPADVQAAVEAAQREAGSAFGDARVFLERFVARARHVEFQVFADRHGNTVHLFERECSIQRRHQKVIEEAPSPALTDDLRERMGAAAVAAAEAIGYVGAGTVEFMVADDGSFFFLEVNTRLQVEHPVTECTTGLDLVRLQLEVAAGAPLPFTQDELRQTGHAIECRVYAEDPARDFLPSTGTLAVFAPPEGPGVRVDTGFTTGDTVTVHYDPMLAKLIVHGPTRDAAIEGTLAALRDFAVLGVTSNVPYLGAIIDHAAFRAGDLHTGFLDEHPIETPADDLPPAAVLIAAGLTASGLIGAAAGGGASRGGGDHDEADAAMAATPWQTAGAWSNT